jgi:hypothetical protein
MVADYRRTTYQSFIAGILALVPVVASCQGTRQLPPVITAFTLNGGIDSVSATEPVLLLAHVIVGARPSEYRVSHRADFAGARWMPYAPPLTLRDWYDASGAGCIASHPSHRVTLYLQVRADVGEEVRIVDGQRKLVPATVVSNVLRATICARTAGAAPPEGESRIGSSRLTGHDAKG